MKLRYSLLVAASLACTNSWAQNPAPAKAAAAPAKAAIDNGGPWTEEQMKKYCHDRASSQNNSVGVYSMCMENSGSKLGKPKQPGDVSALNAADKKLAAKAAKLYPQEDQPTTQTNDEPETELLLK